MKPAASDAPSRNHRCRQRSTDRSVLAQRQDRIGRHRLALRQGSHASIGPMTECRSKVRPRQRGLVSGVRGSHPSAR